MNNDVLNKIPTVAFLGPEGSFSHEVVISHYGDSVSLMPVDSIEDIFDLVDEKRCLEGVVPIENSYEGSVNITYDLFNKHNVYINSEIFLRVRHHLLSLSEGIESIDHVYSHTQALAQCRNWLKEHLQGIQISAVASTSLAAEMASEESKAAAVGNKLAGQIYGLKVIKKDIEDHPDNMTRFFIIGKTKTTPTGNDKTSLLLFLSHQPGALYKALGSFAGNNINLTKIESRPVKTRNWEYMFFLDIEGHEKDQNVDGAMREIKKESMFLKVLGSYPRGKVIS